MTWQHLRRLELNMCCFVLFRLLSQFMKYKWCHGVKNIEEILEIGSSRPRKNKVHYLRFDLPKVAVFPAL